MRVVLLLAAVLSSMVLAGCSPAAAPGDDAEAGEDPTAVLEPGATATPTSQAAADTFRAGDCWGGVLSDDPLHCYVLEQAQMAGEMEVEAIYEAPNNVLHIFLRGSEPPDRELAELFEEKANEFLDSPQGSGYFVDFLNIDECGRDREWRLCMLGFVDFWRLTGDYTRGQMVPPLSSHDQIYLRPGGANARLSIAGWASWRQVWPEVEAQPVTRDSSAFDVSDVDTGNIPEPDCEDWPSSNSACRGWKRVPETGIAGFHYEGYASYFQVKGPLPQDEAGLEALKRKLVPPDDDILGAASDHCYENFDADGLCTYTHADGTGGMLSAARPPTCARLRKAACWFRRP